MRHWKLSELVEPLEAQLLGDDVPVVGVSTDSRALNLGELFVALRGETFDGHAYLPQVQTQGAAAALVSADVTADIPLLRVADTERALGQLGAFNRAQFSGSLVAITGSSGKTTVKNMVAAILAQKGRTLATKGNFNNEIGVPLTLLALAPEHQYAVVEMGAARLGDIAWLVELGRPSVAVLLNALPAHLESFGSVEEIAQAKGEIFDGLDSGAFAIINADQPWAQQWRERAGAATVLDFGVTNAAAVSVTGIRSYGIDGVGFIAVTPVGDAPIRLQLPGLHNVSNALAAIAVGLACAIPLADIKRGLELVTAVPGRLAATTGVGGATIIDDCYNANPASVRAAVEVLAERSGRRVLVLGAMKELGPDSEHLHAEIGDHARQVGIDQLYGVGEELRATVTAFGENGAFFADKTELLEAISGTFGPSDTVLIKGSRSAGMEVVVKVLSANLTGEEN